MKRGACIATLLLGLALLPGELTAGEDAEAPKTPKTRVHQQLNRLIREKAGLAAPAAGPIEAEPASVAEETLMLEPMVIEEEKQKDLPPPEAKAAKFFRTGTVWEKVGRTFTKRFWVDGSRGIGFTLSW